MAEQVKLPIEEMFPLILKRLAQVCNDTAEANGFNENWNDGEKISLMHSELSEMLEALRHKNPPDEHCPKFTNAEVEMADLIIRALHFSHYKGFNLGAAIIAKMKVNMARPFKHGKEF